MYISRIEIKNYRNFRHLKIDLPQVAVLVGANKVGKSNLINAIRLAIDPTLSPEARKLKNEDFFSGFGKPFDGRSISVFVDISVDTENDETIFAAGEMLEKNVARFVYEFTVKPGLEGDAFHPSQYRYSWYFGDDPNKRPDVQLMNEKFVFRVLSALRDTEDLLSAWSRSPLRTLFEKLDIDPEELNKIANSVHLEAKKLTDRNDVKSIIENVEHRIQRMVGNSFALGSSINIVADNADDLLRSIQIYTDGSQQRPLYYSSLGSLNVLYLALLSEEIWRIKKILQM